MRRRRHSRRPLRVTPTNPESRLPSDFLFRPSCISLRQHLDLLHATDNALYPIKAQLLSADVPVATLRTPMIFLIETPQVPLNLTWTWVLSDPIQLEPDGSFGPGPIELDIAPGGRLDLMTRALEGLRTDAVDVVVSSVLVEAGAAKRLLEGQALARPDSPTLMGRPPLHKHASATKGVEIADDG